LIFGLSVLFHGNWDKVVFDASGRWLLVKLIFVLFLYVYHFSLHRIFKQEIAGIYRYSSNQLRIWNEVATIFLISIVMLVVVKQSLSFIWGLVGLILFVLLLMSAIRVYKRMRSNEFKSQK